MGYTKWQVQKNVLELHGSVHRNYCMKCNKFFPLDYIISSPSIPKCDNCGGIVKPDVVLYEEGLDMNILNKSVEYIINADVLIVGWYIFNCISSCRTYRIL